jgi:hypothetical protein
MTSSWEKLGDTSSLESGLCETEGSSQPSTASTTSPRISPKNTCDYKSKYSHDHGVILVLNERIFARRPRLKVRW